MDILLTIIWMILLLCSAVSPMEKVCKGEQYANLRGVSLRQYYNTVRKSYEDCTHIDGNLVIIRMTSPDVNYDLSYLHNIRYVRGYVIIADNKYPDVISLPNLEIIRGKKLFLYEGKRWGLFVTYNRMSQLHMPKLKEITKGGVMIMRNRNLCHMHTIVWNVIMAGRLSINLSLLRLNKRRNLKCRRCSKACTLPDGRRTCWAQNVCQNIKVKHGCANACPYRCFTKGLAGCCHRECAGGCDGPSPAQCTGCKNFEYADKCVNHCPVGSQRKYPFGQQCIPAK